MVTKEPSEYYMLKGRYRFRNLITGRCADMIGYSTPTTPKLCWEKLPILQEEAIDRAKNGIAIYFRCSRKKIEPEWVLVEILNEEWQKL